MHCVGIRASIHDTEYGIPAEYRKNSISTEYEIPQYGIPYSAEFHKNTEFRNIQNSVYTEFHKDTNSALWNSIKYGIPYSRIPYPYGILYIQSSVKNTEFCNLIPADFQEKFLQNSGGILYHGIPLDTLAPMVYHIKPK